MILPLLFTLRTGLAQVEAAFSLSLKEAEAPAVAVALVQDGHTVWAKAAGFTDVGRKQMASPDTVFRTGSLTKAFTATIVLQLVNEKRVKLDDPIGGYLPSLPTTWKSASVRNLLNHTSGIPSYTNQPGFVTQMAKPQTPAQIVAQTAEKPLDFPVGTQFRYDNSGYIVLGMLVEKLDGKPFGKSLERRILKPLGMTRTTLDSGSAKGVSQGFDETGKPAVAIHMSQPYAAGSIVSTVNDLAKWLAAQGSESLLPPSLWKEAWTPAKLPDGKSTGYGFGWSTGDANGVPTIEHGGGIPGFATYIRRVPSLGIAIVVLTNSDHGQPEIVCKHLLEAAKPSLKAPDAALVDPDEALTVRIKRLFDGFAKGEIEPSIVAEGYLKRVEGGLSSLQGLLGPWA